MPCLGALFPRPFHGLPAPVRTAALLYRTCPARLFRGVAFVEEFIPSFTSDIDTTTLRYHGG
ncbi:hypothetical protein BC938DRAFT_480595 [Jimgerdemannia flammicorona]|uniref:Uncharacterized protein n=1 Tax=Jimgerdemannia flammicorona TaxID=994334 RepID=A0A433QI51_9FUNG|nr:hypothetical protein BC938DRAFT_480595 [Jimgerdemannia flammicorona]